MEIPLFPLSSVLFPHGRMSLQIFEQRYLDLIRRCMRDGDGFGVIMLEQGGEVERPGVREPQLSDVGTLARIVDFDSLANGLLGITIQGECSFNLLGSRQQEDKLWLGEVSFIEEANLEDAAPMHDHLLDILNALLEHPHVKGMQLEFDREDSVVIGNILSQLLPIAEPVKYELLSTFDPEQRLHRLDEILSELSGD